MTSVQVKHSANFTPIFVKTEPQDLNETAMGAEMDDTQDESEQVLDDEITIKEEDALDTSTSCIVETDSFVSEGKNLQEVARSSGVQTRGQCNLTEYLTTQSSSSPLRIGEGETSKRLFPYGYDFKWTNNATKLLLELYDKYREKVGCFPVKTVKRMWQIIAKELGEILHVDVTESHCENRWRVLDRNYKKYLNQNVFGKRSKFFEYAEQMDKLFGNKKLVQTQVVLTSETEQVPDTSTENGDDEKPVLQSTKKPVPQIMKKPVKRIKSILEKMREDRLLYQEKRLRIEELKLEEFRKRNELIKERNELIKEGKCCCSSEAPCRNSNNKNGQPMQLLLLPRLSQ